MKIDNNSNNANDRKPLNFYGTMQLFNCGLTSGLLQAAVFNPWDRALYLSIKNNRNFLNWVNFYNPLAGVFQTIIQRTISAGLYFPLEEIFAHTLVTTFNDNKYKASLIFLAGNRLLLHP